MDHDPFKAYIDALKEEGDWASEREAYYEQQGEEASFFFPFPLRGEEDE